MIVLPKEQFATEGLACPSCGCNNLHHGKVTIFSRAEDDAEVTVVTASGSNVSMRNVANASTENPSRRRHGLRIQFWCEICNDNVFELCIAQHKGTTYLHWEE